VRQLFLEKGLLKIREVSKPLLEDHFVLVETKYSFIPSGEELARLLHTYNTKFLCNIHNRIAKLIDLILQEGGTHARNVLRDHLKGHIMPIGHSCSGRVIATGKKVKNMSIGDYVACAGHSFALHAEFVCVPEHLTVKLPDENILKPASITGLGALAMHSIRRAEVALGETVCIFGADSLGILLAQLAKLSGARVIILDTSTCKLKNARDIGMKYVYNLATDDVHASIDHLTQSHGADCSFVCPDGLSDEDLNIAIDITRKRGRVVLVGERSLILKNDRLQHKEIDMKFALAYGPGRYDIEYEYKGQDYPYPYVRWTENRNMQSFVDLIARNRITVDGLISQELNISQFDKKSYEELQRDGKGLIVSYQQAEPAKNVDALYATKCTKTHTNKKCGITVTCFGATRKTRLSVLPIIHSIKGFKIHKIIDRDISRALNAAKIYQDVIALAGDPELFYEDPTTDVVYIATSHLVHTEHIIKALQNGKAVFLQKPIPMTPEDLQRLESCTRDRHNNFTIGFSRRYAPFMQKIKKYTDTRTNPLMINYRINLGALDEHETLDKRPVHGSILDKASHICDIFSFLTDSRPIAVSVETLKSPMSHIFADENLVIHVSMQDGSLCSLTITALGHPHNGVERMEINYDKKTIIMEDFIRLSGFGLPKSFDEVVRIPDKGKEAVIYRFFEELINPSSKKTQPWYMPGLKLTMSIDQLVSLDGGELSLSYTTQCDASLP
jgi:predicted dehydrogenase/threonine dehydrogenase-like Zn-dependent dehydrogenase